MKLLRRFIRQIILESIKDDFEELWYNVEEERSEWDGDPEASGTMHRDQLKQSVGDAEWLQNLGGIEAIDQLFEDKRDLKRLWNEIIDSNDLRGFWEGKKMEYFHSLAYYGSPTKSQDTIATGISADEDIQDLSTKGFIQRYEKSGNRDEMSTYGIYNMVNEQIPKFQKNFGVMLSGRVTFASKADAFTESRSKASAKDIEAHAGSGMPKRIMPTDDMIASLLFEEGDIINGGMKIGECILDNWSIEAVVYNPKSRSGSSIKEAAKQLAEHYGVPLLTSQDAINDR